MRAPIAEGDDTLPIRGLRAVVVDDDDDNRLLLARLLLGLGAAAVETVTRADALGSAVEALDPDVLVVDRHLGGRDGLDALEVLAETDERWWARRILMVTGATDGAMARRVRALGPGEIVKKPYQGSEVRAALGRLVRGPGSQTPDTADPTAPGLAPLDGVDYQRLFESAPGCYLVLDAGLQIVAVTDAYLRTTMTVRNDIVGRPIFEVFPDNPGDPAADGVRNLHSSLDRVREALMTDIMPIQKYDIRRPDGTFEVRHWSPVNIPVVGEDGTIAYIIHRVEDVTDYVRLQVDATRQHERTTEVERRRSELEREIFHRSQELESANRRLREASASKSAFLSRVSHELRTPLTAIMGFGDLLRLSDLRPNQREWVSIQQRAGQHLLRLLDDVLDIARIDAGGLCLSMETVQLAPLIDGAMDLVRPLADRTRIRLVRGSGVDAAVHVVADHQRLRQVLLNLLSNAIKYNRPDGQVVVDVTTSDPDLVLLTVTDTGLGITEEHLARLFQPFDRLDAAATNVEGVGLGLALSADLVTAMRGRLEASSIAGEGSTFTVTLPATEPAAVMTDGTEFAARDYGRPVCVLYVEDLAANVKLVEEILTMRPDVSLLPAMQGSVAVELAVEHQPDLILLDLNLPDMPGDVVLQHLRRRPSTNGIPVVVLSADATRDHDAVISAGATAYLTKPIAIGDFLAVLDDLLGAPS